jgi:hypothetical protein
VPSIGRARMSDGRTKISNELVQQVIKTVELLRPSGMGHGESCWQDG